MHKFIKSGSIEHILKPLYIVVKKTPTGIPADRCLFKFQPNNVRNNFQWGRCSDLILAYFGQVLAQWNSSILPICNKFVPL